MKKGPFWERGLFLLQEKQFFPCPPRLLFPPGQAKIVAMDIEEAKMNRMKELTELLGEYGRDTEFRDALGIPAGERVSFSLLAQGEYNINYAFEHPATGKKLLLRVNTGSQMHLEDQIGYEYSALKSLEPSGRTPKVYFADGTKRKLPYGVLVMEYLPGRALDYQSNADMREAAGILADIHSTQMSENHHLLRSDNPCREILEECGQMFRVYEESELGDAKKKRQIRRLLSECSEKTKAMENYGGRRCCINTELNSTNFLVDPGGGKGFLIDWEKPLYGDPAQDLGHFLAPTTTFWKTDIILRKEEMDAFLSIYKECIGERFDCRGLEERVGIFVPVTCLRGVTWCAMAWVEYQQPGRAIRNESTWKKLNAYLEDSFLEMVQSQVGGIG